MNNEKVTVIKQIYLYRCIPNQLYTFLKTIVKLGVTRLGVAFHRIKAEYQFSFPTQTTLRKKLLEECINKMLVEKPAQCIILICRDKPHQ